MASEPVTGGTKPRVCPVSTYCVLGLERARQTSGPQVSSVWELGAGEEWKAGEVPQ